MTAKKPKKIDRRIRRTRRQLKTALRDLMLEQRYDKITVENIVDKADISRATFYLHYTDKDDLLHASFASIVDVVKAVLEESEAEPHFNVRAFSHTIFKYIHEHRLIYQQLFKIDDFGTVVHLQITQMIAIVLQGLQSVPDLDKQSRFSLDFYAMQIVVVTYATLRWYLETNATQSPEELTEMVTETLASGIPFISPS